MKPWLSADEVKELTGGRIRPSAQLRQLKAMGMDQLIRYRTDGSFIVMREVTGNTERTTKEYKLDFSGLGNGTKAA